MKRSIFAFIIAAFICGLGTTAIAADATPAGVAKVDMRKAFDDYKVTKTSNDEIERLLNSYKLELDTRAANRLLTDAQLSELVKLKLKTPLVDADRKRIDELENLSKQMETEVDNLAQKKDPDDKDRARMRELKDLQNTNDVKARSLAEDYQQQAGKRKDELSDKITNDIKVAIEKVAQAKGYAVVVDKIAVLYGGTDITEDVIKMLNK